jgi:ferritin-like metal-binding protein YciE
MNDLQKLFVSELKDIYDAEQRLVRALSELEVNATSVELKAAFHEHGEETKNHVNRLEQVFGQIGESPNRKTCHGIEGIVDEGQTLTQEFKGNSALDAALISAGQKAEHYEISTYGTLCSWAKKLGYDGAFTLLHDNLNEEKEADAKLTALAESSRNAEATLSDTKKKSESAARLRKVTSRGV